MAVVAAGLPPLLPTPTSCVGLTPPPASYAPSGFDGTRKPAGRASLSESWIRDKEKITGGIVSSADRKVPGRASLSSSWVDDKKLGLAGTSNSSVERAGRSTWRDSCGGGGKRPASRAPSADQTERKQKPLIIKTEATPPGPGTTTAAPATTIVAETAATTSIAVETEAAPAQEVLFAGPSFIALPPDPSELPLPTSIILRLLARFFAAYVIAELSSE